MAETALMHRHGAPARIIHDDSSRNRRAASREWRVEPGVPEAYSCSTSKARGVSPPPAGLSQQRTGDCSRSAYESCGLTLRQLRPDRRAPRGNHDIG